MKTEEALLQRGTQCCSDRSHGRGSLWAQDARRGLAVGGVALALGLALGHQAQHGPQREGRRLQLLAFGLFLK